MVVIHSPNLISTEISLQYVLMPFKRLNELVPRIFVGLYVLLTRLVRLDAKHQRILHTCTASRRVIVAPQAALRGERIPVASATSLVTLRNKVARPSQFSVRDMLGLLVVRASPISGATVCLFCSEVLPPETVWSVPCEGPAVFGDVGSGDTLEAGIGREDGSEEGFGYLFFQNRM
jgi:hypothetical protein